MFRADKTGQRYKRRLCASRYQLIDNVGRFVRCPFEWIANRGRLGKTPLHIASFGEELSDSVQFNSKTPARSSVENTPKLRYANIPTVYVEKS